MTVVPLRLTALSDFAFGRSAEFDFTPPVGQFGPVPPGYIWTGTLCACISQTLTSGAQSLTPLGTESGGDALSGIIWTLYRNGAAEQSWIGLSSLCNVQAFANDVLQIAGQVPDIGVPVNTSPSIEDIIQPVTFSFLGYAGTENEVELTVPFISTSVQSVASQGMSLPSSELLTTSTVALSAGTTDLLADRQILQSYQLWGLTLDLSVGTQATARADANIQSDSGQAIYLQGSVVANGSATASGNATVAHDLDARGIVLPRSVPLQLVVTATFTGTGNSLRASATVYYSFVQGI